jgi:hypothetical protein
MLTKRFGILICSELLQELVRALHVTEEKGDGSGREIVPQRIIMRPGR